MEAEGLLCSGISSPPSALTGGAVHVVKVLHGSWYKRLAGFSLPAAKIRASLPGCGSWDLPTWTAWS